MDRKIAAAITASRANRLNVVMVACVRELLTLLSTIAATQQDRNPECQTYA